jgi:hypothetical protein
MTWELAITDGPVCDCRAQPHEHQFVAGSCEGDLPKPPLGGIPIWDENNRMVGQHPAPPPR